VEKELAVYRFSEKGLSDTGQRIQVPGFLAALRIAPAAQ